MTKYYSPTLSRNFIYHVLGIRHIVVAVPPFRATN